VLAIGLVVAIAGNVPPASVLWAALAGVIGTLGLAASYPGMAVGSISVVAPIAAVDAMAAGRRLQLCGTQKVNRPATPRAAPEPDGSPAPSPAAP
jgi:hypothetical protein